MQLKADMAASTCPEPVWHSATSQPQIPAALKEADQVFVQHGARLVPLSRPYDGPYRVLKREGKYFVLPVETREQVISIDRLKRAFGFIDPVPNVPNTTTPERERKAELRKH